MCVGRCVPSRWSLDLCMWRLERGNHRCLFYNVFRYRLLIKSCIPFLLFDLVYLYTALERIKARRNWSWTMSGDSSPLDGFQKLLPLSSYICSVYGEQWRLYSLCRQESSSLKFVQQKHESNEWWKIWPRDMTRRLHWFAWNTSNRNKNYEMKSLLSKFWLERTQNIIFHPLHLNGPRLLLPFVCYSHLVTHWMNANFQAYYWFMFWKWFETLVPYSEPYRTPIWNSQTGYNKVNPRLKKRCMINVTVTVTLPL